MKYFLYCLQHYADFDGRARRSEFWYWQLFATLCSIGLAIFLGILAAAFDAPLISAFICIWYIAIFIPDLAVSARRLHDIGKSGWFLFMGLIPIVGGILLLVWYCTDSEPGENQYGPNPKGVGNNGNYWGNPNGQGAPYGYQQPNNGGYQQPNNGGYQQPNNGGYQQPYNGGYQQPNNGGYPHQQ